jgi:hypothetical protein
LLAAFSTCPENAMLSPDLKSQFEAAFVKTAQEIDEFCTQTAQDIPNGHKSVV